MDENELRLNALKRNCLRCSVCGWEAHFKKSSLKEDLEHYRNALAIWCPRNICQSENADKRKIPDGYIATYRHQFWATVEVASNEELKAIQRAKDIRDMAFPNIQEKV